MNRSKRSLPLFCALTLLALATPGFSQDHPTLESADWKLSFDGQYKLRGQFDSGKNFVGDDIADREWLSHRARIGMAAAHTSGTKVVVRFQDVRVWGEETHASGQPVLSNGALGMDIHEAYALVPLGVQGLSLQLGKQEIILDQHRIVGNLDWTMRARRFDAARLRYAQDAWDVSGFAALITERDAVDGDGHVPAGGAGDVYFGGVHGKYAVGKIAKVSLMSLARKNDTAVKTANELRLTEGLFAEGKVADVSFMAEFYQQLGHLGDKDISASMLGVRAAYSLPAPGTPTVGLFFEDLSGDGNAPNAFELNYGTNHRWYGEMDYFLAFGKDTLQRGLRDMGVTLSASPAAGLSVGLDVHLFATHALAGDALKAAGDKQPETDLGKEVDVRLLWKFQKGASLHVLYGLFQPGEGMRSVKKIAADATLTTEHLCVVTLDTAF
ncbi:MAG: alginate export family protein [Deltaproteobacteria bacterium]|nr:alginate export family protein [Deltaproteobacteria bacterium]